MILQDKRKTLIAAVLLACFFCVVFYLTTHSNNHDIKESPKPEMSENDSPASPETITPAKTPEEEPPPKEAIRETDEEKEYVSDWVTKAMKAPRVEQRIFESKYAGGKVSYHVYTPECYDRQKERRFPVLYWLHGSGGGLDGIAQLAKYFNAAISSGRTPPMIVVFPNGLPNGMWCDSKDRKTQVESVVIRELIPHIDGSFRTIASREGRIIEGFSMGGYGAARIGFKYHELFRGVSILGAGPLQQELKATPRVSPVDRAKILREVYGNDQKYFIAQSPWVIAGENVDALNKSSIIRMAIGSLDETLGNNQKFHARMEELGIEHTYTKLPGVGHKPFRVLTLLGKENWKFYRASFGARGNE